MLENMIDQTANWAALLQREGEGRFAVEQPEVAAGVPLSFGLRKATASLVNGIQSTKGVWVGGRSWERVWLAVVFLSLGRDESRTDGGQVGR